jgi:hypothetical protein
MKLKPKPRKQKLKIFVSSWPKLKRISHLHRPTERSASTGKIIFRKMLKNFANPKKGASRNPWIV